MSEVVIDLRYLAESQPSLCIPRVFNNITEARIRQVFDDLGLGKISRIDIKERKNEKGDSFKRVYVHFDKWFWNEDAQAARRKLVSGKEIKIVYDNPWFWKVSASKWAPSNDLQDRSAPARRSRAHIDFEDSPRATDEFGRDIRLRKESDDTRRRDDSRERRRPDNRRRDDSRERPSRRTENRNDRRSSRDTRIPIAPTLQRKSDNAKSMNPRTPDCSPPRERPINIDTSNDVKNEGLTINYGDFKPPAPTKKRQLLLKKKPAPVEIVESVVDKSQEEGEIIDPYAGMSEQDRIACEQLYGDL